MRYIREHNKDPKPIKWKYDDPSRRIRPVPISLTQWTSDKLRAAPAPNSIEDVGDVPCDRGSRLKRSRGPRYTRFGWTAVRGRSCINQVRAPGSTPLRRVLCRSQRLMQMMCLARTHARAGGCTPRRARAGAAGQGAHAAHQSDPLAAPGAAQPAPAHRHWRAKRAARWEAQGVQLLAQQRGEIEREIARLRRSSSSRSRCWRLSSMRR